MSREHPSAPRAARDGRLLGDLCFMPATSLARLIRQGEVSPGEVVEAFLKRIEACNPRLNAYVTVLHERAREKAQLAERALATGQPLGPLHGVPVALKDLEGFVAGVRHTFGSLPFADNIADQDAAFVQRLEQAGAIVLGKTNTPEFGHKGTTDNRIVGPTSTPFSPGRNSGGSSGGSAAAVAAGLTALAQGSDGGGSIRIPSSWCGVFGMKASYGRVPNVTRPNAFGSHTPFALVGPLARTVEDAALMLSVIGRPDPSDPFSLPDTGLDYLAATRQSVRGLKIAYSPNLDVFPVEPRVRDTVGRAVTAFSEAGAVVEEVRLGFERPQQELSALWIREASLFAAEVALENEMQGKDLLGKYRAQLIPQFVDMIEKGEATSAMDARRDDMIRTEVFDVIQKIFEKYDLLVTPTLAALPVANADDGNTLGPSIVDGEAVDPQIGWCLTYLFNFTGHPAASIPAGFTDDGLPVGMQIVGRRFADDTVLAASAAFERIRPWFDAYHQCR